MAHEPYHLAPITVVLSSLTVADSIAQILMPGSETYTIAGVSASCRSLVSGTATLTVKNGAGSSITAIVLTAGSIVAGALSITTISGGDKLRVGLSGLGIGLQDVTATIWVRLPSVA